jgi:pimeloyl-ACP methyl ester carboxylesterase
MSTFVLVHGAWHGGWCWYKMTARLEARGHRVFAPDMPGHGVDRTPIETVTLDSIVERICQVVDAAPEPVVLVGHSYGGAVISQTAERRPHQVRTLAYVTALLLANGQSASAAAEGDGESILGPEIEFAPDGLTATVNPKILREAFYAQCRPEDIALARACLVPEALAGFQTPVQTTGQRWGRIPRVYVECLNDRAISAARQRKMYTAQPCEHVYTMETDHSPFFSAPDELTGILHGL